MSEMLPTLLPVILEEEENRTLEALLAQDTEGRYEFKILHGTFGVFGHPDRLQAALDEEGRAQWELVLKLDEDRIVLRRPKSARARDVLLGEGTDSYRTDFPSDGRRVLIKIFVVLLVVTGITIWLAAGGIRMIEIETAIPILVLGMIAGVVFGLLARRRRG